MKLLSVIISVSILAASSARLLSSQEGRIIGGSDAKRGQFPYMVSVQLNGRLHCGGTIVSKSWVVSAAHCYEELGPLFEIRALAGLLHFRENHTDVQNVRVIEVINHPEYVHVVGVMVDYDISLLKLASPLTFTEAVQPLALPQPEEEPSGNAWLSGWGIFQVIPPAEPTTLQCLEMPIIAREECKEVLSKFPGSYQLLESMICVVPPKEAETGCYGDSGSPLAQKGKFVGIASWIAGGCGVEDAPTVFTKVSLFIDFINEHIKDGSSA